MEIGDKLQIIEKVVHNKRIKTKTTIGIVQQIAKCVITIRRIHNGELKNNVSFNLADFTDTTKKFYIEKNNNWIPIQIKISHQENRKIKAGGKYD